MRARLKGTLSYSNIVSTLALFAAVGGISYAAVALPRNSVGTEQLQPNAVTPPKLGFSLGITESSTELTVIDANACPPAASCPPPPAHTLTSKQMRLKPGSSVLLVGSATFSRADGAGSDPISLRLGTGMGRRGNSASPVGQLEDDDSVAFTVHSVVSPPTPNRPRQFVLQASATVEGQSATRVNAYNARLIAIALPAAL